jgi:LPXTG-motif cell wall-anchored protein
VPSFPRRVLVALLVATALVVPAGAFAQTSTIPESGAGVSSTPPVPLTDAKSGTTPASTASSELPNTGSDPRMLFLAGLALTLLGFGLRLRTADADDY